MDLKETKLLKLAHSNHKDTESKKELFKQETEDLKNVLPDKIYKRVENFINTNTEVYSLDEKGNYKVINHDNERDGKINSKKVILSQESYSCSCNDNFYRNIECKHIWAVRIYIIKDILPDIDEDPYNWYSKEINKIINQKNIDKNDIKILNFVNDNLEKEILDTVQVARLLLKISDQNIEK